ncbi:MAG: metalloregulator ArsR/SmtB family transcription factor [Pseudomonadota bacterium]
MPARKLVARELAEMFKVIAHPDRIRLIEELRGDELDVNSLAQNLELPGTRVSQHLALLRAHRIVEERRDGRHHFYQLTQPELAPWIVDALAFVEARGHSLSPDGIDSARRLWTGNV